jgi:hypothetical protein
MSKSLFLSVLSLFLSLFFFISCTKDKPKPSAANSITLSSETFGTQVYFVYGYSFEKQSFYQRISSGSDVDIYLNELVKLNGEPTGAQFTTNTISESTYGFYLNAGFNDLTSAEEYYKNYTQADFPEYVTLSDTIKEFQVYTFRTWKSNYVKFLVKELRMNYKGDIPDFIEVDIEYFIQRDGSVNLAN